MTPARTKRLATIFSIQCDSHHSYPCPNFGTKADSGHCGGTAVLQIGQFRRCKIIAWRILDAVN
jgi:hypothetical protein